MEGGPLRVLAGQLERRLSDPGKPLRPEVKRLASSRLTPSDPEQFPLTSATNYSLRAEK